MGQLPEVVRRRLPRVATAGDHPDAGLMTAFVEGTLAACHRDQLLGHLAACSECNRLITLIAPEHETAVAPVVARRPWFAWTPLRWAGAAATAAAVLAGTVWMGRIAQRSTAPSSPVAIAQKAPAVAAQVPAVPSESIQNPSTPPRNSTPQTPENRQLAKAGRGSSPAPPAQFNPAIAAQSRPAVPGELRDQSGFQTSMISGAAAPPEMSATPAPVPLKVEPAAPVAPAVPPPPARAHGTIWSVSDAGVLQKSDNSGDTWAAVPVPTQAPLRALSVLGQDIWIGGDQGALFHSTDGGQNWAAIKPAVDGETLTADIMRIAFSDPRHGWIATRQGKLWSTRDGGATWSRN